jgi:hypothetical protein
MLLKSLRQKHSVAVTHDCTYEIITVKMVDISMISAFPFVFSFIARVLNNSSTFFFNKGGKCTLQ